MYQDSCILLYRRTDVVCGIVAGKPQAAPAASGVTGDGAQSSPFSSSSSSSSSSFSVGSTAGAMPDVKKFLEELSKQLGI